MLEFLGLGDVARVAIQHEAVGARQRLLDHRVDDDVGHEVAGVHVPRGRVVLEVELADVHVLVRPECVAGGDVLDVEPVGDGARLGPLPGPWRTNDQYVWVGHTLAFGGILKWLFKRRHRPHTAVRRRGQSPASVTLQVATGAMPTDSVGIRPPSPDPGTKGLSPPRHTATV